MFLSVGHRNFVNLSVRHRIVSSGQNKLKFFCPVDTKQYPVDKFTKLRCPTDKNMENSVYQTKPRTRSVPRTNVP
jgi:hypothetical protein